MQTKGILQFTHCKKCNQTYLVGVKGKDIRDKGHGGDFYIALGNDELEQAKTLAKKVPCRNCGFMCTIKHSK